VYPIYVCVIILSLIFSCQIFSKFVQPHPPQKKWDSYNLYSCMFAFLLSINFDGLVCNAMTFWYFKYFKLSVVLIFFIFWYNEDVAYKMDVDY
jgi:hypothetical protein